MLGHWKEDNYGQDGNEQGQIAELNAKISRLTEAISVRDAEILSLKQQHANDVLQINALSGGAK